MTPLLILTVASVTPGLIVDRFFTAEQQRQAVPLLTLAAGVNFVLLASRFGNRPEVR